MTYCQVRAMAAAPFADNVVGPMPDPMGMARAAGDTNPTGTVRQLCTIACALGRTMQEGEGWMCEICQEPTFGCASCGNGICAGCATAAYAMSGTSIPVWFGGVDDEDTGETYMTGGCPFCRANWVRQEQPFFESDGSAVYRSGGWTNEVGEAVTRSDRRRTIIREIRSGDRAIETDGSAEAWACVWLSGILDTPVKRVFFGTEATRIAVQCHRQMAGAVCEIAKVLHTPPKFGSCACIEIENGQIFVRISKGLYVDGGVKAMREVNWHALESTAGQIRVTVSRSVFSFQRGEDRLAQLTGAVADVPEELANCIMQQVNSDLTSGREVNYNIAAVQNVIEHILSARASQT